METQRRNRQLLFGKAENTRNNNSGSSDRNQAEQLFEQENNQAWEQLHGKVGSLKDIALQIGEEVNSQNAAHLNQLSRHRHKMRIPLRRSKGNTDPADADRKNGLEKWEKQLLLSGPNSSTLRHQQDPRTTRSVEDKAHPLAKEQRTRAQMTAIASYNLPLVFA